MKFLAGKPGGVFIVSLVLLLLIDIIDYITGNALGFFVFYFIPIAIAAWYGGKTQAILISVISTITWFVVDLFSTPLYSDWLHRSWNTGIRCVAFLIIALTLVRIRAALDRERTLNKQLTEALDQVQQLSGLLPICASCKRVRDDQGYWEQIETYISNHSSAEFSHSICPECIKRLYPGYRDEEVEWHNAQPSSGIKMRSVNQ